ncbi:MAG: aspartate aminotransferase family protein [Candidatus Hydrogenedentes bacterium]|nr:aspartate aminotransferase family protein [Candidatus Hydrogenedentota bacterium]
MKQRDKKQEILDKAAQYVCPGKVETLQRYGIDLVIGRREGYFLYDVNGRRVIDFHLNGGVYNLGHRNPELVVVLKEALDELDIGNHHFPSAARAELGEALAACTPGKLCYSVFSSGGGEAVDVAIKTARRATGRRKIVSIHRGYHGHTGLALAAGDERFSRAFLSEGAPDDFVQVPFNDIHAIASELCEEDVAAVLIESIPATLGFPLPAEGYLPRIKDLCSRHGALYIADEVQTGLGRTGTLWAVQGYGVEPDILITAKGLSGGLYPIAATVISEDVAGWLHDDGFAHISTFGGAELGCRVALKVLEITQRPEVLGSVATISQYIEDGLRDVQQRHRDFFAEIRRNGLVMGLRFNHEQGGMLMSKMLYDQGIWAIFAAHDPSVLQFKPGLLIDKALCDDGLKRFEDALSRCAALAE